VTSRHSLERPSSLLQPVCSIRLSAAIAACVLLTSPAAQAQWLVTPEEAQASQAAPQPLTPRTAPAATPGSPRVNLLAPNLSNTVPSPTRIQVRFEATAPARIQPETFKVRYGAFRLDITNRITAASKVTAEGIDVAEAPLPKGAHRLLIEIEDSLGRVGERLVQFVIE